MEITKETMIEAIDIAIDELLKLPSYQESEKWVVNALSKCMEIIEEYAK